MPIFDDPGKAMRNIEQELLDEQARETAESGEEGANSPTQANIISNCGHA